MSPWIQRRPSHGRGTLSLQSSVVFIGMLVFLPRVRKIAAAASMKDLWILRHGQATHNPRAEDARARGCTFDDFFELMRQDDSLDSPLTEHGRQQALNISKNHGICVDSSWGTNIELVVSSPLSRALETANLALPPSSSLDSIATASQRVVNRVCYEGFREINGVLLNAQRRTASELRNLFPDWNFEQLSTEEDDTWNAETLECTEAAALRGLRGLRWLYRERSETSILLVAHGGILRHVMEQPLCLLQDERMRPTKINGVEEQHRPVSARFGNCELRRYRLECRDDEGKSIVLTEVDVDHDETVAKEESEAMLSAK